MEWEFTPEQVVKAEADYGFEDFRRDLRQEVFMNTGGSEAERETTFDLLFDLCYWLATGRELDHFMAQYHHSPPVCEFIGGVAPAMDGNVKMFGAILQRMIMNEVESGTHLEEAVSIVDRKVKAVTGVAIA